MTLFTIRGSEMSNVLNFSLYYSTQSCGNIQFTGIYLLSATL